MQAFRYEMLRDVSEGGDGRLLPSTKTELACCLGNENIVHTQEEFS
jgi:hypothetical protein